MKSRVTTVKVVEVAIATRHDQDCICLTDMLKAEDGDFFISDWLRNRNTVEFLGIWECIYNPDFNYGEFTTIKSQGGLNNYKSSAKEWTEKTRAITSCNESGNPSENHFASAGKMVGLGSCSAREVEDYRLSRFACYLSTQAGRMS